MKIGDFYLAKAGHALKVIDIYYNVGGVQLEFRNGVKYPMPQGTLSSLANPVDMNKLEGRSFRDPDYLDIWKVVGWCPEKDLVEISSDESYRYIYAFVFIEEWKEVEGLPAERAECIHEFVNMGFMHVKMVCRKCNKEMT